MTSAWRVGCTVPTCVDVKCYEGNRQDDVMDRGMGGGAMKATRVCCHVTKAKGRNRCSCVSIHLCIADTLRDT